jgi:hypothetical protein
MSQYAIEEENTRSEDKDFVLIVLSWDMTQRRKPGTLETTGQVEFLPRHEPQATTISAAVREI